jgi:TM2 domain-containing membrane protein YozV
VKVLTISVLCLFLLPSILISQKRTRPDRPEKAPPPVIQETLEDAVYLKNGSIIRGQILELEIGGKIKIQTKDGSLFVYDMEQVEKIVKEKPIGGHSYKDFKYKNPGNALALSLIVGALTPIQGSGQLYNGEVGKGLAFTAIGLIGTGLIIGGIIEDEVETIVVGGVVQLITYAVSAIDAYQSAERINKEHGFTDHFIVSPEEIKIAYSW